MTTAPEPTSKRQKLQEDGSAPAAAADAAPGAGGAAAAPVVAEQIAGSELVPALQQLLSLYQSEYWALLEELRAKHSAAAVPSSEPAPSANAKQGGSTSTSMQQLWREGAAERAAATAVNAKPQQEQQQQPQDSSDGALPSPFAAAVQPAQDKQQQQQPRVDVPSLQQAEQLLLQLHSSQKGAAAGGALDAQQLQEMLQRWDAAAEGAAGLEQLASAAAVQYMDAQGGLACLCGQHGRWVLRRSAVSIGRSTDAKGDVDIDLSAASAAAAAAPGAAVGAGLGVKVSRLQAQLLLTADGSWSITNTGRAVVSVNGQQVPRGSTAPLPHLSLLEVAGLPLLFMVNSLAVQRAVARSLHLAM